MFKRIFYWIEKEWSAFLVLLFVLGLITLATVALAQTFRLNTRTSNSDIVSTSTAPTLIYLSNVSDGKVSTTTVDLNDTQGAESFEMNISAIGSSTASKLLWVYETSENGITYYQERCATANSNFSVTYGAEPCTYDISLKTSTTTINIPKVKIAGKFGRVKFSTSGNAARIHVVIPVKEPTDR